MFLIVYFSLTIKFNVNFTLISKFSIYLSLNVKFHINLTLNTKFNIYLTLILSNINVTSIILS